MKSMKKVVLAGIVLAMAAGSAIAGINGGYARANGINGGYLVVVLNLGINGGF